MAVPEQIPVVNYVADGVVKKFDVPFEYDQQSDLHLYVDGDEPTIDKYFFADNSFNFYIAPTNGQGVKIKRITPKERDTDYDLHTNTVRPKAVNSDFDRIWLVIQEVFSDIGGLSQAVQDEIIARIHGDDDLLNQLTAEISARMLGDEAVTEELKNYVNQVVGAIINDPTFDGIDADKVNDASGETQQQINYNGGSKWHSRVGGYLENERVVLTNGDIVKSTIDGNTNDPNSDMTGWIITTDASFVVDASGKNQQEINNKFLKENISVEDFITNPLSADHTYAFIALNTYFSNKDNVEFSLGDRDYSINVSTANLLDFRGKESVIIHAGSAKIKDNSSYTAPQTRNIINVDDVNYVQITGILDVEGKNTATSPSMAAIVIKAANNKLLKGVVKSKGNNAAVYDNLGTGSKNWDLVIFSENDHYPLVCSNVDVLNANIVSVNSYRSFFLMGVKNGTVNILSTGQRGTSLIKAYSHHLKSYDLKVNANFEGGEPTETYVAPASLEIQSDIPVSLEDIHVNLNISQNPLNPWLGGSFSIVNYKANGALQTAAVGHKIDGLTVSGNIDGGSSTDILKLMRFGNFYSGDTVDNIELRDLNLQGTGNLNINFAAHKRIKLTNVTLPNGKLLLLNKNAKQPVIISDSEINEVALDSSGYLKFSDSVIKSRVNLVDSNFGFENTSVDGWNINRKQLGADEQLGFYKQGDLSVAFPIFKATGQVRARCRVNYYVVKDIASTTINYESGYIEFLLYVTPTGTVTIAGKTKTVIASNGEAVTIDVTGQNNSGFGSVLFSATNYNSTLSALTCDINFNMIPIAGNWYAVDNA